MWVPSALVFPPHWGESRKGGKGGRKNPTLSTIYYIYIERERGIWRGGVPNPEDSTFFPPARASLRSLYRLPEPNTHVVCVPLRFFPPTHMCGGKVERGLVSPTLPPPLGFPL